MRIPEFDYHRPESVREACALAASLGAEARFLAGGTELVTDLKRQRFRVRHVIALSGVPGLSDIRRDSAFLRVGALTRLEAVAGSALVRESCPVVGEAAGAIGCAQIREQGTLGGNFCGAVPCADSPPACIVSRARVRLVTDGGERTLAAEEFFRGPRETALEPGEMLAEILVPLPPEGFGAAYHRFSLRRGMAVAVASVAASVTIRDGRVTEARVALGAVAPVPLLATASGESLAGAAIGEESIRHAATLAGREARPICDVRGTDDHRREIVEVLTRRAITAAAARAVGEDA